jgi:hypothetical protein
MAQCSNCVSAPGREAHIFIEVGEGEREISMPLCDECRDGFNNTAGITISRAQSTEEE